MSSIGAEGARASIETAMQTSAIHVFREDPIWDTTKRWFQLPAEELARLYVMSYEVRGESVDVSDVRRHAQVVRRMHPDCVLIHI